MDGKYKVYVRAVDAAGNVSAPIAREVTVDTMPPRVGSFTAATHDAVISPDKKGALSVYADSATTLGVSLEEDTVAASAQIGLETYPLRYDIASGLWQSTKAITIATTSAICISAEDELHNAIFDKCIGSFAVIPRGIVRASIENISQPVFDARIQMLVFNEETDRFEPAFSLTNGTGEIHSRDDGTYELALREGKYRLVMTKPGYRSVEKEISLERSSIISENFDTEKLTRIQEFIQTVSSYFQ